MKTLQQSYFLQYNISGIVNFSCIGNDGDDDYNDDDDDNDDDDNNYDHDDDDDDEDNVDYDQSNILPQVW